MGVEKMSVSFELSLGEAIRGAAATNDVSVSAWLAEAARARLRLEALDDAVRAWERKHGALTDAEVAAADSILEKAGRARRRRVA